MATIDENLTNWEQLLKLLHNYCRRIEDTALCVGCYEPVPNKDEELGILIWTLQQIYYQHVTKAEKEAMVVHEEEEKKREL